MILRGVRRASALALACLAAAVVFSTSASAADPDTLFKLGREVFTRIAEPQCGICHTLEDAGTTGTLGANLEELRPDAARVAKAVREGVGIMPPYGEKLTKEQIEAVSQYVARAVSAK